MTIAKHEKCAAAVRAAKCVIVHERRGGIVECVERIFCRERLTAVGGSIFDAAVAGSTTKSDPRRWSSAYCQRRVEILEYFRQERKFSRCRR